MKHPTTSIIQDIVISRGKGARSNIAERSSTTFQTLADEIESVDPASVAKEASPWFTACTFKAETRNKREFESAHIAVLDSDEGSLTSTTIRKKLEGLNYIAYTSYRHTPEYPRWRILVELASPVVTREHYAEVVRAIEARFGEAYAFDKGSREPERLWFWKSAKHPEHYTSFSHQGEPFDPIPVGYEVRKQETPAEVPTDICQDTAIELARQRVEKCTPAYEGQGGDLHTFNVACLVRDLGVAKDRASEALEEWNQRCEPPWEPEELQGKIANAYRYGQNNPGCDSVEAWFDKVTDAEDEANADLERVSKESDADRRERALSKFWKVREELPVVKPIWGGGIVERGIGAVFGKPGSGKSYFALGLAIALARDDDDYLGRSLMKGLGVVYVDVDSGEDSESRLQSWGRRDGRLSRTLPLHMHGGVDLLNTKDVEVYIEDVDYLQDTMDRPIGLIVIDALGSSATGVDLNKTENATKVAAHLKLMCKRLNCALLLVAHSPKTDNETISGSIQFDAAFATMHHITPNGDSHVSIKRTKGRSRGLDPKSKHTLAKWETAEYIHNNEVETSTHLVADASKGLDTLSLTTKQQQTWDIILKLDDGMSRAARKLILEECREQDVVKDGSNLKKLLDSLAEKGRLEAVEKDYVLIAPLAKMMPREEPTNE